MDSQAKSYGGREEDRKAKAKARIDGSRTRPKSRLISDYVVDMNAGRISGYQLQQGKKRLRRTPSFHGS